MPTTTGRLDICGDTPCTSDQASPSTPGESEAASPFELALPRRDVVVAVVTVVAMAPLVVGIAARRRVGLGRDAGQPAVDGVAQPTRRLVTCSIEQLRLGGGERGQPGHLTQQPSVVDRDAGGPYLGGDGGVIGQSPAEVQ